MYASISGINDALHVESKIANLKERCVLFLLPRQRKPEHVLAQRKVPGVVLMDIISPVPRAIRKCIVF